MGTRFEIFHNGDRLGISGINGKGVLSTTVTYVDVKGDAPRFQFNLGGLGHYTENSHERQHVRWHAPEIAEGDEITIRILPAGDFDDPVGMRLSPQKTIEDPDFGSMNFDIRAWDADIPWEFPPFDAAHLHLHADEHGPTDRQRQLILELRRRYEDLWPQVAETIVKCHEEVTTSAELEARLNSCVGIEIEEESDRLELAYQIPCESGPDAFFVTLHHWEIVEFCSAS